MNPMKKEILLVFLCFLVGFALRFYSFDQKSLWIDEVHTFNDSRDNLKGQLIFYKENPTTLHPPLFYILTHLFYPFDKPEKDLRIIPLIFGTLSIPIFYLLSRSFASAIAFPCTLSLTFMTYHIYFSQDGRMYSLLMFFGMLTLYFFMKYLKTHNKIYLAFVAIGYAVLFHASYSSILFIAFSQLLWFYRLNDHRVKPNISSFFILTGITFTLCVPWIVFLFLNHKGQAFMDPLTIQDIGSFWNLINSLFNDWAPQPLLMVSSAILLALFPFLSKNKRNSLILLGLFILPVGGLYFYCKLMNVTQFITSRYFINFLPFFLITLYLSLATMESKFGILKRYARPRLLFLVLFIVSNLIILPYYYRAEKQDFRGLVNYLSQHLQDGDKIFVGTFTYIPGILHYFKVYPKNRNYSIPYSWITPGKEFEFKITLTSQNRIFHILHSNIPYDRYVADGNRLWIVIGHGPAAEEEVKRFPSNVFKGYFDGSVAMFRKFPSDASMYLHLWDPKSPLEKGIE